jgi:hypothetical protein
MSNDGKYQTLCEYSGYIYTSNDYGKNWNIVTGSDNKQQNWSSVCISRGNLFVTDYIKSDIVIMKPTEILPPQNITIPLNPGYDTVNYNQETSTPPSKPPPSKPIVTPPHVPSPAPSPVPSPAPSPVPSDQNKNKNINNNDSVNILFIIIPIFILFAIIMSYYYLKNYK